MYRYNIFLRLIFVALFSLLAVDSFAQEGSVDTIRIAIHLPPTVILDSTVTSRLDSSYALPLRKWLSKIPQPESFDIVEYPKTFFDTNNKAPTRRTHPILASTIVIYLKKMIGDNLMVFVSMDTIFHQQQFLSEAIEKRLRYIISFSDIRIAQNRDSNYCDIRTRMFSLPKKSLVIDSFFHCKRTSMLDLGGTGALLDATGLILSALDSVLKYDPTIIFRDKMIEQQTIVLRSLIKKPFSRRLIDSLLPPNDPKVKLYTLYYAFINDDSSKFIAFYHSKDTDDLKIFKLGKVNNADAKYDYGDFISYSGVKFNNRWYVLRAINYRDYRKPKASDFYEREFDVFYDQAKDIFKKSSLEIDPEYWDTGDFDIASHQRKNIFSRGSEKTILNSVNYDAKETYIGLPYIVANTIRENIQDSLKRIDSMIEYSVFRPYYNTLLKQRKIDADEEHSFKAYNMMKSDDGRAFLGMFVFDLKNKTPEYVFFVTMRNSPAIYQWQYFPPVVDTTKRTYFREKNIGDIIDIMAGQKGFHWMLEFNNFWDEYVLKQKDGKYLYLRKVK